jgi:hypothetical protein
MNYDPECSIAEEREVMESYMEKIREEVLKRLSPLEVAAIFEDAKEFIYRWREQEDIKRGEDSYE